MGVNKKTDGRYIVGMGAPNENEYKGSMGWRDIFIQLTENGATPDSEEKLAFLRDYAIYHNGEGNAIMPPSVSVWVSNNGVTSAVNADDITLEDGTYTICGIKWDGSSWDYTNAGQSSGGGGSSLPSYTSSDVGKVLTVGEDAENPQTINIVPQQTVVLTQDDIAAELTGYDFSGVSVGDTLTLTVDDHSETVTVITGGGVELAVAATYSVQGGQQTVQIGFVTGTGAGFDCLFRGTGGDTATRKPGTYTVSLTKSVPSVAPVWQGAVEIDTPFTAPTPIGTTTEELYNSALNGCRPVLSANIDGAGYRYFHMTDCTPAEVVWATIFGAFGTNSSINIGVLVIQPGKGGVYNMTYHNLSTELSAT